ncbi:hypothetical protein [Acidocella aminolytica]|uniref:hypothetical protein n=1 Tax=Acidocella aminolytica TaxID=33998 RepID=UPI00111470C2|nr:hypothetical protein [Acidocella aminolytica]
MAALERLGNIRSANASDGFPTSPVDVAAGGADFSVQELSKQGLNGKWKSLQIKKISIANKCS